MSVSELGNDLQILRAHLAEELGSINRFEPMIETIVHEEARDVVKRVADARKQHVAWLSHAIEQLDPKQAQANRAVASQS